MIKKIMNFFYIIISVFYIFIKFSFKVILRVYYFVRYDITYLLYKTIKFIKYDIIYSLSKSMNYIFKIILQTYYFIKYDIIYSFISFIKDCYRVFYLEYYYLKYFIIKSKLYFRYYTKSLRKKIHNQELWQQQQYLIALVVNVRQYLLYLLYRILSINIKAAELKVIIRNIVENLDNQNKKLLKECDEIIELFKETDLNIIFFGETRAGKSTLIETLNRYYGGVTKGIGTTIGNGMGDFTKSSIKYTVKINNTNINLIDIPGIEGNEEKYEDMIKSSLRKAHIVIYIQGSDKSIEKITVQKIKQYLNRNSNIYSIMNIHLQPKLNRVEGIDDPYIKELEKQINNLHQIENDMIRMFKDMFSEQYKKHMHINILQAFFAVTYENNQTLIDDSKKDLISQQNKYLKEFKNIEEMLETSMIRIFFNEITNVSNNYIYNIISSNKYKIQHIIKDIYIELEQDQRIVLEEIKVMKRNFGKMNEKLKDAKQSFNKNITNIIPLIVKEITENTISEVHCFLDKFGKLEDIVSKKTKTKNINKEINKKLNIEFNHAFHRNISRICKKNLDQMITVYNKQVGEAQKSFLENTFIDMNEFYPISHNIFIDVNNINIAVKFTKITSILKRGAFIVPLIFIGMPPSSVLTAFFTLAVEYCVMKDTRIDRIKNKIADQLRGSHDAFCVELYNTIENSTYIKRINKNFFTELRKREEDIKLLNNNLYGCFMTEAMHNIAALYDDIVLESVKNVE